MTLSADVIILAGGLGTRLKSVLPDTQKAIAPVDDQAFLDLLLEYLNEFDFIGKVIIAVGYRAQDVVSRYGNSTAYRFKIEFAVEETLLGTGGGIKNALQYSDTPDVVMLNGDTYSGVDLFAMISAHRRLGADMTVAVSHELAAGRYGTIVFDADNRISSFSEKTNSGSSFVNVGTSILRRELFDDVPAGIVLSMEKDLMPRFVSKNVYAFIHEGGFIDIGTPESYARAEEYFRARKKG